MTAVEDLQCAPGEEAQPFEDGYACGPSDLPMVEPLPVFTAEPAPVPSATLVAEPAPVAPDAPLSPVPSVESVGATPVPGVDVLAETGADGSVLLALVGVLILVGFSLAMLAALSKLIEFESTTPRYKRTPQ